MSSAHLKWPGLSATSTLVISVDRNRFGILPGPLEFHGRIFKPKQETHITVFGSTTGTAVLRSMQRDPAMENRIIEAFESTDWSWTITGDYRHLARSAKSPASALATEDSIIVLIEMNGMQSFYDMLKVLGVLDRHLPVPPPHVTLYTSNCDTGIGVHSIDELEQLTRVRLTAPAIFVAICQTTRAIRSWPVRVPCDDSTAVCGPRD